MVVRSIKKHSILRDYFTIFIIMIIVMAMLAIWFNTSIYKSKKQLNDNNLFMQTHRIERELNAAFDYVTHLMRFLGEEILKDDPKNLQKIARLLGGRLITTETVRSQFSWEMFDWSTPDKKMVVSTQWGVLTTPKDISHRYYAQMAPKEPWVLHFDAPDIGISSGQWIIPAGMGITGKDGTFYGTLSLGFNIFKLAHNIGEVIDGSFIRFIVLDSNNNIIFTSFDIKANEHKEIHLPNLSEIPSKKGINSLTTPITIDDNIYKYYTKLDHYPYKIIVGHQNITENSIFNEILHTSITIYIAVGIAIFIILVGVYYRLIAPVIKLCDALEYANANNKHNISSASDLAEFAGVAVKIKEMKTALAQEKKAKNTLEKVIAAIKDSDKEKENFIKDMNKTIRHSLDNIIALVEKLQTDNQNFLNSTPQKQALCKISQLALQIRNYTTYCLNYQKVNVSQLIEKCVAIHKRFAAERNINIIVNLPKKIPDIMADELRLRQVIVSTMFHSLNFIPTDDNRKMEISANIIQKNKQPYMLRIEIKDNGIGMDEKERIRLMEAFRGYRIKAFERDPQMTKIDFATIRDIVKLHHGEFHINSAMGAGSVFTIEIPYVIKNNVIQINRKN